MKSLINVQTGLIEFTGAYDECLAKRKELIKEQGGVLSCPNDYYRIN